MTLFELVVSSVVLAGSSSAAMGVWNQAANEIQSASQLDAFGLELETARIATDRWLQSAAASVGVLDSALPECSFNVSALEAAVDDRLGFATDVGLHWSPDPQGLGLWLELSAGSQDSPHLLSRRLLFTPAAYGLCDPHEVSS